MRGGCSPESISVSDSKRDDSPANLECLRVLPLHREGVLEEDKGAKFGLVILYVDPIRLVLDYGMGPAHRDVIHPHLRVVPPTHIVGRLIRGEAKEVDRARGVLLEGERLEDQVVATLQGHGSRQHDVHQLVHFAVVHLEEVGVSLLADLALEGLPEHAHQVLTLLPLEFGAQPVLKALEMHEPHTTLALAGNYARILLC
jgi:hypothetical protein